MLILYTYPCWQGYVSYHMNILKTVFIFLIMASPLQAMAPEADEVVLGDPKTDMRLQPYPHTLIGPYVWARPVFPQDWVLMAPLYGDTEKMQHYYTGKTYTPREVKDSTQLLAQNNLMNMSTLLRSQNISYGWTFFNHAGISGRVHVSPTEEGRLELSYVGQGGTAQASQLVLDYLNTQFLATVHRDNVASQNVLSKLGFNADSTRQGIPKKELGNLLRDYYLFDPTTKESSFIISKHSLALQLFALCLFGKIPNVERY